MYDDNGQGLAGDEVPFLRRLWRYIYAARGRCGSTAAGGVGDESLRKNCGGMMIILF
jgi:hypothetical protein